MLFGTRPRIRRFSYQPFFYEPKEEAEESEGRRIRFRRPTVLQTPVRRRSILLMLIAVAILVYLIHYLGRVVEADRSAHFDHFQVEEIIVR
ncbi:MAG: hypothetical protein ONB17_04825 [candidate division KSB1 bacterium]|nr:hypothetical protein [candidate division KSB1 bacterium]MDZ7294398.1 hypothetical protein [candidate division KSB1 bacterium]MDZ7393992.1 hypothetical protein [candidate division KSB1 bacterium]